MRLAGLFAAAVALAAGPGALAESRSAAELTDLRPLVARAGDQRAPAWRPDGVLLAFESDEGGDWSLWTVGADGSGLAQLTGAAASERFPAWSPEGEELAFQRSAGDVSDLCRFGVATGAISCLPAWPGAELHPSWSPDGERIAFTRELAGEFRLFVADLESGEATPLTPEGERSLWPRWTRDGGRLAYFSRRDTGGESDDLYEIGWPGGPARRLTSRPGHEFCPDWSPDGRFLVAAVVTPAGERHLEIFDRAGRSLASLAAGFDRVTEPAWSPRSERIAFTARRAPESDFDLFVLDVPPLAIEDPQAEP